MDTPQVIFFMVMATGIKHGQSPFHFVRSLVVPMRKNGRAICWITTSARRIFLPGVLMPIGKSTTLS